MIIKSVLVVIANIKKVRIFASETRNENKLQLITITNKNKKNYGNKG